MATGALPFSVSMSSRSSVTSTSRPVSRRWEPVSRTRTRLPTSRVSSSAVASCAAATARATAANVAIRTPPWSDLVFIWEPPQDGSKMRLHRTRDPRALEGNSSLSGTAARFARREVGFARRLPGGRLGPHHPLLRLGHVRVVEALLLLVGQDGPVPILGARLQVELDRPLEGLGLVARLLLDLHAGDRPGVGHLQLGVDLLGLGLHRLRFLLKRGQHLL